MLLIQRTIRITVAVNIPPLVLGSICCRAGFRSPVVTATPAENYCLSGFLNAVVQLRLRFQLLVQHPFLLDLLRCI